VDWDVAAREATAMLRFDAARHPHDPAVVALVDELAAVSSEFRRIWGTHEVDVGRNGRRRYRHPLAGEIVLHSERLDIPNAPDQTLFAYSVVPGSSSDAGLRRLAHATESAIAGRTGGTTPMAASRKAAPVFGPPNGTRSALTALRPVPTPSGASWKARAERLPPSSAATADATVGDLQAPVEGRLPRPVRQ